MPPQPKVAGTVDPIFDPIYVHIYSTVIRLSEKKVFGVYHAPGLRGGVLGQHYYVPAPYAGALSDDAV